MYMAKYLLLYNGASMPETEAEMAEVIKAREGWYGNLGSAVSIQVILSRQ
jgi:hypothetical protein